jgi:hypothetical protein
MAKTTAKKTTRKTTTQKTTTARTTATEETPIGEKSCAYPSCSARATQTHGDNNVPSCDHHASIFETQAKDGAGIQHLMENHKG